ncbi:MAG: 30S ribosomal protein S5 [Abditibacteriota bacterium]|nr:30S ribosomal protein S5 [Abditibacteriota bacterium]
MAKFNAEAVELEEQIIRTNKVQKTHKGGRTLSWSVLIAVGDRNGHVGIGLGKARAIPDAIRKASEAARKSMIEVTMVGSTIPHEIEMNYGAAKVRMKPASEGTGVVAGGAVRPILELAGVRDVLAKSLGSPNAINTAKAAMRCLTGLRKAEDVCRLRGMEPGELVPWMVKKQADEAAEAVVEEAKPAE